jgi:hypothetical protein
MADKSKAKTVGVNVALDKTFEKGLKVGDKNYFQGINIGFEGFVGQTEEEGAYNVNPPTTKDISISAGATTKKGTRFTVTASKSKAEGNQYYPDREEKKLIFGIQKSFNKGGKVKKAYLGSYIAGGPNNQSNQTYRKYYKGMV